MSVKRIKNEQWTVKDLIHKVKNREIEKPKYQRKKKWDILPKKNSEDKPSPNEKNYIEFLFDTQNSVHAITVGHQTNHKLSNIDGNNRINAIYHFLAKPFDLFREYLDDIFKFIVVHFEEVDIQSKIQNIFASLDYNELMNFKYNAYFLKINETELYHNHLKIKRDEFEPYIEELQQKLKVNGQDNFDATVKININIFEGYTTDELCKTFEDINKYNSTLTEIELLACRLYNISNFKIRDNVLKTNILETLKSFYGKRNDEALSCYEYNENDIMNAYDFMVGFQNYAHKECPIIEEVTNAGLPLFFKVYRALYKGGFDITFTDENMNDFIQKMMETIRILKLISERVFISNLTASGKNLDVVNAKLDKIKTNSLSIIISSIIGYTNEIETVDKKEKDNIILKSIEKTILFHLFINDLSKKEQKDEFRIYDYLKHDAGGAFIFNLCEKMYKTPSLISEKITDTIFSKLIDTLLSEQIRPKLKGKNKVNRRPRKFYEGTLMYYYYKNKVPTQFLKDHYWIEHIIPFCCSWEDEIDNDRLGNIVPILASLNMARGIKHISEYKTLDKKDFMKSIDDFIPDNELYDSIVKLSDRKLTIVNNDVYNAFCERNEHIYKKNILDSLFV